MRLASIGLAVAISSPVYATAAQFNFINRCPFMVNMWDNAAITNITARNGVVSLDANGKGLMWRHGYDPQATLAEVTVDLGTIWYDISAIPPGTGNCSSYDNCNDPTIYHGSKGFNVALAMVPRANINGANCRPLVCLSGRCNDAFLYPYDNSKVHSCPDTTPFDIIFCPGGIIDISKPRATVPPMPRPDDDNNNTGGNNNNGSGNTNNSGGANNNTGGNTNNSGGNNSNGGGNTNNNGGSSTYKNAFYEYTDDQAGNVPGFYNRVTDLATCSRQRIDVVNPVGPLSEEVTMVFRGPMEIYNIAVYGASPTTWPRLSSYTRGGPSENLVFFNNKNIDYSGLHLHGPQIFASSDGNGTSTTPKVFNGSLADAANPNDAYSGPGISTGVEVNIMTAQRCGISDCRGYSAGDYNYRGWSGDRKIFVTRVKMPMSGSRPNMPAIWMLNAQVMYTGQYSPCNCRGQGAVGGCGELDIAEVIDNGNPRLNRISTHYYFYDGQVQSAPYGDNYASRPIDRTATYVTIFDATAKDGLIKILEIDDSTFDFSADSLTNAQVQRWISSTA